MRPINVDDFRRYIIVVLVLVLMLVPVDADNLWWRELLDSTHVLVFILIAYQLFYHLRNKLYSSADITPADIRVYLLTFIIGVSLGVIIEVCQYFVGREMSLQDVYKDIYGLIAGIGLAAYTVRPDRRCFNVKTFMPLLVFVCALTIGVAGLLQLSAHYLQRAMAFPKLTAFDQPWSSSFVRLNKAELEMPATQNSTEAAKVYPVRFKPGKYPGVSVIETVADWSGYHYLYFYVVSRQDGDIKLSLRVHDVVHNQELTDRYNKPLTIRPGMNEFYVDLTEVASAPEGRTMMMEAISGIKIFASDLKRELIVDISDFQLK